MSSPNPPVASTTKALLLVAIAALVTLVLSVIPFAGLLNYPFALFSTFIHETGHILATLVSFGSVDSMVVHPDTSGVTYSHGGSRFLIGSAGYMGTTIFGVLLVLSARSSTLARWALGVTGLIIVAVTSAYAGTSSTAPVLGGAALGTGLLTGALLGKLPLWGRITLGAFAGCSLLGVVAYLWASDGLLTWTLGLASATLLLLAARYLRGDWARFAAAFLGVQVGLDALGDVTGLVGLATMPSVCTDAHNMARDFGLPPVFWALGWAILSIGLVLAAMGVLVWDARRTHTAP